jgi:DNA polymerase-3 subunit alpha
MYLIFDTETTGLPRDYNAPLSASDNWPRAVQLAWQFHDQDGKLINRGDIIIRPDGFTIPFNAEKVHGVSTDKALREGRPLGEVLSEFNALIDQASYAVGHNIQFDINILGAEFYRLGMDSKLAKLPVLCTQTESTDFCALPGGRGGRFKFPQLAELFEKLFGYRFDDAHNAAADVESTARAFFELVRIGIINPARHRIPEETVAYIKANADEIIGLKTYSGTQKDTSSQNRAAASGNERKKVAVSDELAAMPFTHLHCHSQFSVLQSTIEVDALVKMAAKAGSPAVALTDLGNMYGAFNFVKACKSQKIKPIIGCEVFVVEDHTKKQFTKENKDYRHNQVLLAKNKAGYKNLIKICSTGWIDGYYGGYPRISKAVIAAHKDNLIATTGGLLSEIPDLILNVGEHKAEEAFVWWLEQFGEDFYVQLMRHGLREEDNVNTVLLQFARKYQVKVIAANNVFYTDKEGASAHDILLCIQEGEVVSTPKGRGRGFRPGMPNDEFYFKSPMEMKELFADIPEAIVNTQEIVDKIEAYELKQNILLPAFQLPEGFEDQNAYLRHLTYEGAKQKYPDLTPEIIKRLDYELEVVKNMGFPGYFLIVADFTTAARRMGVYVGPGRGSAAGSAVAFAIGITNIDPLKYDLLFERFLNPERVSMPDIDIDFDDEGRDKVIQYVIEKYGRNQVAQIVTYGTMGPKLAIRDVARTLELPLSEANELAKRIPKRPGTTFDDVLEAPLEDLPEKGIGSDEIPLVKELREIVKGDDLKSKVIREARVLEGSVRNTGIHACGIIITPDELFNHVPLCVSKEADLLVSQFDNKVAEDAGLLKMDFLGLKTLSILKTAIQYVEENHGKHWDLDDIPLDDAKTFELYQKGDTVGTFQFESDGMRKYLRDLKPTTVDDLIAMNALYRPGPLEFIPNYINRKHGREEVDYMHASLEDILTPTYGIMVYQEQIMQVAQRLASYTLGEADILRRIMGKKKPELLPPEKEKFIPRAIQNGVDQKVAEAVFEKMAYFAGYGFNKSHSAAYSVLAYQTAFFKANYPAEYMASVLTHNMGAITDVQKFIEESNKAGIPVDAPNINTGTQKFTVREGRIQYGLEAIKGVGGNVIEHIVAIRKTGGPFRTIFDFSTRVDLRLCNRRVVESLVFAGAFDCINTNRAQLVESLEDIMNYAQRRQHDEQMNQASLFGGSGGPGLSEPKLKQVEPWSNIEKLKKEREYIGFFLSAHPLHKYRDDVSLFCSGTMGAESLERLADKGTVTLAGIITVVKKAVDRKGLPMAWITLEDEEGSAEAVVFSSVYDQYRHLLEVDNVVVINAGIERRDGTVKLKLNTVNRIETLRENHGEKLRLRLLLDLPAVSDSQLQDMAALLNQHKGKSFVTLDVTRSTGKPVRMNSRRYLVDCSDELMQALRSIVGNESVRLEKMN